MRSTLEVCEGAKETATKPRAEVLSFEISDTTFQTLCW